MFWETEVPFSGEAFPFISLLFIGNIFPFESIILALTFWSCNFNISLFGDLLSDLILDLIPSDSNNSIHVKSNSLLVNILLSSVISICFLLALDPREGFFQNHRNIFYHLFLY